MKGIYLEEYFEETKVKYKDEDGYNWFICTLVKGKPMELIAGLPKDIGFPVDENGCILTRGTYDIL